MKARRRKKADPRVTARALAEEAGVADSDDTVASSRVSIDRREVDSTLLVQLDELEHIEEAGEADVDGAIVKVCPRLPASQRDRFDGAATGRRFRELGARGVIIAPIIVPDGAEKPRALAPNLKPRELVDAWLEEQHLDDDTTNAVRDCVVGFMDAEGL